MPSLPCLQWFVHLLWQLMLPHRDDHWFVPVAGIHWSMWRKPTRWQAGPLPQAIYICVCVLSYISRSTGCKPNFKKTNAIHNYKYIFSPGLKTNISIHKEHAIVSGNMLGKPEFAWHFSGNAWNTVYVCFFCGTDPLIWKNNLRVVCLILLTLARGGTYIVEQPGSSILRYYHRFDWLCMETTESCLCLAVCIYGNVSILPFIGHKPVFGHLLYFQTFPYICLHFPVTTIPKLYVFHSKENQWFGLPGAPFTLRHSHMFYFPLFTPLLATPSQIGSQFVALQLLLPVKVYSIGWWMKLWGAKTPKKVQSL